MKRRFLSMLLALVLVLCAAMPVYAATDRFLYDEAGLLTESEAEAVEQYLAQTSDESDAQLVVITLDEMDADIDVLLDYLYDSMGIGYGPYYDGALLLICMDVREYRILSNGYAGEAISNRDISDMSDQIGSYLSAGYYRRAMEYFADSCGSALNDYQINGDTTAADTFLYRLGFSLVFGVLTGLIVVLFLRGQLKSVRKQTRAHAYVKTGSMNLTARNDIFLYRNVHRTKKESSSSSRSGGGGSRSRGGGSF